MSNPTVSTSYSHAAPYIRRALCYAAYDAKVSRLKRDQGEARARMYALALALDIMAASEDQTPAPGIADKEALPQEAIELARKFLGTDAATILGE